MGSEEFRLGIVIVVALTLFLGVAIPSCIDRQRKAVIECLKSAPSSSPEECRKALQM